MPLARPGVLEGADPQRALRILPSKSLNVPTAGNDGGKFGTAGSDQADRPMGRQCAGPRVYHRERPADLSTVDHDDLCAEKAQVSVGLVQPIVNQ